MHLGPCGGYNAGCARLGFLHNGLGETILRSQRAQVLGRVEERRGSLGHAATLRFLSPLIEPDVRFRIRLSDKTQVFALERL